MQQVQGDVEAELVYPLLRGRDVQHWVAKPSAFIVLPHDPNELDRVLPTGTLQREYPHANRWLRRNRAVLSARIAPPTRNWNMTAAGDDWCRIEGPLQHMQRGFSVAVRELSERPAAALVEPAFSVHLHRTATPLIDHKLMFHTLATRDEALYLVAMVNSTPMQDLLASFTIATAVSPRGLRRLPIPDSDAANADTKALVALAIEVAGADDSAAKAAELQAAMDEAVLRLVSAAPDYEPQPRRARKRGARRTPPSLEEAPPLFDV